MKDTNGWMTFSQKASDMPAKLTVAEFLKRLKVLRSPAIAKSHGHLASGENDEILGVRRHDRIDTWDIVDRSAPWVVGGYLMDKPRRVLYKLAKSKKMPERRTAIVSTLFFIGKGDVDDAFNLAEILLYDKEDLIHKANGWALRFAGNKDRRRSLEFLDQYAADMPRVTLRYATEHFDRKLRDHYLKLRKA